VASLPLISRDLQLNMCYPGTLLRTQASRDRESWEFLTQSWTLANHESCSRDS